MLPAPVVARAAVLADLRALAASALSVGAAQAVPATVAIGKEGSPQTAAQVRQYAGRSVHATVIELLDEGNGLVDIGGQRVAVHARLPAPGSDVLLRFAAGHAPALTAPAPAATTPGAGVRDQPPAGARPQVVIGPLAAALAQSDTAAEPPRLLGPVAAPPTAPAAFALALATMIRDSGLFYEAHLARYSRGGYPLEQLAREPQAGRVPGVAGPPADTGAAAPQPPDDTAGAATPARSGAVLPEALRPIVREQLEALEHRCLAFAIEPWPGQRAVLEIRDDAGRDPASGSAPAEPSWTSRLTLDLPHLGRIDARLALRGVRLALAIEAGAPAADRLSGALSALEAGLRQAGLSLNAVAIDHAPGT
ncbi:MAG: flagellar hook-length control protein FliK [Burkholderiales bacterium]|nr:flagellar hook-length control protein FliK [Burkholderiales bacterium]